MDFTFTEDQLLFADSVKTFLQNEVTADQIRASWDTEGRDDALWSQIVELGLPAMLVLEAYGGLGMSELDFILIAEECGRVALAEPLLESVMIATPLLSALAPTSSRCAELLEQIAGGEARIAIGHSINPVVLDADRADWLILPHNDQIHLLPRSAVEVVHQESVDPSRRLFTVEWDSSSNEYLVAEGDQAKALLAASLNRGALLNAVQLVGLAQGMVEQSVVYSNDRQQFGKPIGVNQALKHHMANCAVSSEFAKAPLYRAAFSVSQDANQADIAVSQAKASAGEAALLAAKNCIQLHGAMGYTWECNLHIWMKRAWALDKSWGAAGFHKKRIHQWLLDEKTTIGAVQTFSG